MIRHLLNNKNGVALLFIVGVLAVLVIIAMTFAIAMRLELITAENQNNNLKAVYLAETGLNKSIREIIEDAKSEYTDDLNDSWCSTDSSDISFSDNTLLSGFGKYEVYVYDTQRMININNANAELLKGLPGIGDSIASSIISTRPFETKHEITKVTNVGETLYNNLKDYITVNSWVDPSNSRSPVNVNTATEDVIKAILEGAGVSDLDTAYNVIVVARPFSGWSQFNESIDDSSLSSTDKNIIKTNCNPNRFKPSPFTTEFCFNSGGFYEIHAKGILYNTDNQSAITAEKEVTAVVHVYDIWSKTTKEDFTAGDTDFDGIDDTGEGAPEYEKVNWLNSCPVNSNDDDLLYGDSANYETIPGSIKLGFWDNFDEENFGTATGGYGWSWEHWQETIYEDIKISDKDNDGDNELTTASHDFSSFELMGISSGQWNAGQRFMVRAHYGNHSVSTWEGWEDTGALEFQGPGDTHKLFLNEFRCIYWGGQVDLNYDGNTEEVEDFMDSMLRANWYGGGGDHYMFINDLYESDAGGLYSGSGSQEYPPDGNRINPSSVSYKLVVDDRSNPNYTPYLAVNSIGTAHHVWGDPKGSMSKTYTADNTNFHARPDLGDNDRYDFMWHDSGNSFLKNDWRLKLYANSRIPEWDEVRIIYPEGFYTSPTFTLPAHSQLGAISWTETIPESADPSSEKISLKINRGSGFVTPSSNGAVFGQSGDLTGAASTLQFKVTLSSDDVFHEQTPVFEDLSLTYLLPKTEILYWSKK